MDAMLCDRCGGIATHFHEDYGNCCPACAKHWSDRDAPAPAPADELFQVVVREKDSGDTVYVVKLDARQANGTTLSRQLGDAAEFNAEDAHHYASYYNDQLNPRGLGASYATTQRV